MVPDQGPGPDCRICRPTDLPVWTEAADIIIDVLITPRRRARRWCGRLLSGTGLDGDDHHATPIR